MIITSDLDFKNHRNLCLNKVIFDSFILMIFIIGCYIENQPKKKNIIKNEHKQLLRCMTHLIRNLRIKRIYTTPTIFSEFVNLLRNHYKDNYVEIEKGCLKDLENLDEIYIHKNSLINHNKFIFFGNDISLLLATEEDICRGANIGLFSNDIRFMSEFFENKNQIFAFHLDTLKYFI